MYKVPGTVHEGPGNPPDGGSGSSGASPLPSLDAEVLVEGDLVLDLLIQGGRQVLAGSLGRQHDGGRIQDVAHVARDGVLGTINKGPVRYNSIVT